MATPPTPTEYEAAWNSTTTPKTVSVTVAVGDVLVVLAGAENGSATVATPTGGTGFTWTTRKTVDSGGIDDPHVIVFTATATAAQTFTLSVARGGSAVWWGFNCLKFTGTDGVGAVGFVPASGNSKTAGAPSIPITTTGANSAVVVIAVDWDAADGTSRASRTTSITGPTEYTYFRDGAHYSVYVQSYPDSGAAGAKTVGWTAPSMGYSAVAVEVFGTTSSGSSQTVIPGGVSTGAALGAPALSTAVTVAPGGVATAAALGTPTLSATTSVTPTGVATGAALGTPTLTTSGSVVPTGIATGAALGAPSLSTSVTVTPTGVPSGAAVGTPDLSIPGSPAVVRITGVFVAESQTVTPAGIATAAVAGTPTLTVAAGSVVRITGVAVSITANASPQTVTPTGVTSGQAVGTPALSISGGAVVRITGVAVSLSVPSGGAVVRITGVAVSLPVASGNQTVVPTGIPTAAAPGTPTLSIPGSAVVRITGVVVTITAAVVVYEWQRRVAGNWVDVDWVMMERRAGVWEPLDS